MEQAPALVIGRTCESIARAPVVAHEVRGARLRILICAAGGAAPPAIEARVMRSAGGCPAMTPSARAISSAMGFCRTLAALVPPARAATARPSVDRARRAAEGRRAG
jgi:hypothetical protein